jgi:hypothetical protein
MDTILRARQAAIARASEVVGGLEQLSARLVISRPALQAMLDGRIGVPQRLFFELVDIISMESPAPVKGPEKIPLKPKL